MVVVSCLMFVNKTNLAVSKSPFLQACGAAHRLTALLRAADEAGPRASRGVAAAALGGLAAMFAACQGASWKTVALGQAIRH